MKIHQNEQVKQTHFSFITGLVNERENLLFLHAVDRGDSGVYICSAMNTRGFHAQYISFIVNGMYI